MSTATFYVYIHMRLDNNQVFYVGKGRGKRAGRKTGRNKYWKNIVEKYGFIWKIVQSGMSEVEAFKLESALIFFYKFTGLKLANLTDGGEGVSGLVITDERKAYLSEINSGRNNPFYGKEFTEEHKRNISLSKRGEKHHLFGLKHAPKTILKMKETRSRLENPMKNPEISGKFKGVKNCKYDHRVFVFFHAEKGYKICTGNELTSEYQIHASCMSQLKSGKIKTAKGWSII